MNKKNILMMAAGTGGHVFPALAVAKQLQEDGYTIHWLGTPTGIENRLLKDQHDITMHHIDIKGMRGNGIKRLLETPFKVFASMLKAYKLIKENNISVVVGFGGYVAAPGGLAAKIAGVPLVIHEQNAVAGMTNTYLAKISQTVLQAFPNTFVGINNKLQTVGNPIRSDIVRLGEQKAHYCEQGLKDKEKSYYLNVLVIGGSLGAQVLNENVAQALTHITTPVRILHQCGRGHLQATQQQYDDQLSGSIHNYEVREFVQDMAKAYEQTDMLICRAGASTVSEVAVAGVPAIFVPLPYAVDDHQTANAKSLTEHDSGILLPQKDLTDVSLANAICSLAARMQTSEQSSALTQQIMQRGVANSTELAVQAVQKYL